MARSPEPSIRPDQRAQTSPPATVSEKSETLADSSSRLQAEPQAKPTPQPEANAAGAVAITPAEAPVVNLSKDAEAAKATPTVAPPTYAPEPAGAPAPKPQDQVEVRREAATTDAAARPQTAQPQTQRTARDNYETSGDQVKEEERARKREDKDAQVGSVASQNTPDQNKSAKLRTLQAGRGEGAGTKADEAAAEIRSVAGRRFRRQGSMWVDTAYQSGISLTHVARGSEQYRALIADEPSIRSVAEQLQGEVILIWKGRGYRIR